MNEMTKETAAALLKPFPEDQIGTLPRAGIQLSYVGHADVTRRLCEVDPEWTWEPFAVDSLGAPVTDHDAQGNPVGLWIKLTVCGVTRPGYGSCPSNQSDAVKVLIGDALRNAAMRFGVAVDLWAKGDRAAPSAENATSAAGKAAKRNGKADVTALKKQIVESGKAAGLNGVDALSADFLEWSSGKTLADAAWEDLTDYLTSLQRRVPA